MDFNPEPSFLSAVKGKGKGKGKGQSKETAVLTDHDKGKGKETAVDTSEEETSSEVPLAKAIAQVRRQAYRRSPRATGVLHETPCSPCAKKNIPCEKEVAGGACVSCYKGKKRCTHSGVKQERIRKRKVSATREKVVKKRVKSMAYVEVTSDSESDSGEMAPAPQKQKAAAQKQLPPTKHRTMAQEQRTAGHEQRIAAPSPMTLPARSREQQSALTREQSECDVATTMSTLTTTIQFTVNMMQHSK